MIEEDLEVVWVVDEFLLFFDIDWRGFGSSICSRWILLLFFECLLRWGFGSSKSSRKSLDVSRIGDIIDDNLVG